MNGKYLACFLGNVNHFLELCRTHRYRLFTDHVFPGAQRLDNDILVSIVRGRAKYDIDPLVCEQIFQAVIGNQAVVSGKLLSVLFNIKGADCLQTVNRFNQFTVEITHSAQTNNRMSYISVYHGGNPLFLL